uniref:HNH endonuclease n=1 Tax=viral metagenome TaxID=1070528 RepID=A0A6C0HCK3_9ZZZZ
MEEQGEKKVLISGTNNRYQIKKLTRADAEIKKRKVFEKWGLSEEYFTDEKQLELIKELFDLLQKTEIANNSNESNIIKNELNKKISSYKQQDITRKLLDTEKFIDLDTIITMLFDCKLECYYCKEKMAVLYELTREMKQWSVDRINNDLGHNRDNIVMACLDCNLRRRRKGKDAFLFTKQLNIIKSEENAF